MTLLQREQRRLALALDRVGEQKQRELRAAQWALAWASDPGQFKNPSAAIMGTAANATDCRARRGPPRSLCNDGQSGL